MTLCNYFDTNLNQLYQYTIFLMLISHAKPRLQCLIKKICHSLVMMRQKPQRISINRMLVHEHPIHRAVEAGCIFI